MLDARPYLTPLAVLAIFALGVPGARAGENPFKTTEAPAKPAPAPAPAAPRPASQGKAPGKGSFKVTYSPTSNQDYQNIQKVFRETHLLEDTAKELNDIFILPADLTIALGECGEANAFYEADKKRVTLCYELIDQFSDMFLADAKSKQEKEDAGDAIAGATMFTLYHELGHALIDLYDLPVTGKEEDAVDQLATIILLEGGDEGEAAAINGATSFISEEDDEDEDAVEETSYWDEHALGEQRFYNILCWTYGKNPEGNQDMVDDDTLPKERADRCPDEYAQMSKSWDTLLSPHMKD